LSVQRGLFLVERSPLSLYRHGPFDPEVDVERGLARFDKFFQFFCGLLIRLWPRAIFNDETGVFIDEGLDRTPLSVLASRRTVVYTELLSRVLLEKFSYRPSTASSATSVLFVGDACPHPPIVCPYLLPVANIPPFVTVGTGHFSPSPRGRRFLVVGDGGVTKNTSYALRSTREASGSSGLTVPR
jgi:hypothetical protein